MCGSGSAGHLTGAAPCPRFQRSTVPAVPARHRSPAPNTRDGSGAGRPHNRRGAGLPRGANRRRRPTLAAIADAGFWLPTVSKVVNGRPNVVPDTRALVQCLLVSAGIRPRGKRRPGQWRLLWMAGAVSPAAGQRSTAHAGGMTAANSCQHASHARRNGDYQVNARAVNDQRIWTGFTHPWRRRRPSAALPVRWLIGQTAWWCWLIGQPRLAAGRRVARVKITNWLGVPCKRAAQENGRGMGATPGCRNDPGEPGELPDIGSRLGHDRGEAPDV